MDIIFSLRGLPIYTHRCPTQGCPVILTAKNPMAVAIAMPKQKVGSVQLRCLSCYKSQLIFNLYVLMDRSF